MSRAGTGSRRVARTVLRPVPPRRRELGFTVLASVGVEIPVTSSHVYYSSCWVKSRKVSQEKEINLFLH